MKCCLLKIGSQICRLANLRSKRQDLAPCRSIFL